MTPFLAFSMNVQLELNDVGGLGGALINDSEVVREVSCEEFSAVVEGESGFLGVDSAESVLSAGVLGRIGDDACGTSFFAVAFRAMRNGLLSSSATGSTFITLFSEIMYFAGFGMMVCLVGDLIAGRGMGGVGTGNGIPERSVDDTGGNEIVFF